MAHMGLNIVIRIKLIGENSILRTSRVPQCESVCERYNILRKWTRVAAPSSNPIRARMRESGHVTRRARVATWDSVYGLWDSAHASQRVAWESGNGCGSRNM